MNNIIKLLFISILLANSDFFRGVEIQPKTKRSGFSRRQTDGPGEIVKKTFEIVRKNASRELKSVEVEAGLSKLKRLGENVIPFLEPYLNDANIQVRRETINLAFQIGGEKSLRLIAAGLRNSKPEIRKLTADNLYLYSYYSRNGKTLPPKTGFPFDENLPYESFSPEKIASHQEIGVTLKESVKSGNAFVSTIFLLANFPGGETKNVLTELLRRKHIAGGGKNSSAAPETKLAAAIIEANADDREALLYLSEILVSRDHLEPAKFLLSNIIEIKSSAVLSILAETLNEQIALDKQISSSEFVKKHHLPKGGFADQMPPPRLSDFAVDAFVGRFGLKISFALHSSKYTENQISEVRDLVKEQLKPQP